jgi:hypothetical protein
MIDMVCLWYAFFFSVLRCLVPRVALVMTMILMPIQTMMARRRLVKIHDCLSIDSVLLKLDSIFSESFSEEEEVQGQ